MNKLNMAALFKDVRMAVSKHSPEILTGLGIAGMITTTVLAVKATPKALDIIEDKKKELGLDQSENLRPVEVIKVAWKPYIPAVITGVTSIACLIGANSVNVRRNAALATAYNLSTTALAEYKDKVIETIGEKKEKVVRDKIAEDRLKKEPVNQSTIVVSGNGTTRCFDTITKQRFISDIETMRRIVNDLNERMINGEDYIYLNEFYYDAQLDSDGVPCIVIDYAIPPEYGFNHYR